MEAGGEIKRAKQTQEVKKGKMNGDILVSRIKTKDFHLKLNKTYFLRKPQNK